MKERRAACSICSADTLEEHHTTRLAVRRCVECQHRSAVHRPPIFVTDYYLHTSQSPSFLASLEVTRRRQARLILRRMLQLRGSVSNWLDFGAGRGFFLDEARALAEDRVGGFDASPLARACLEERGIRVARQSQSEPLCADFSSLGFSPQVVSLLDVLEHFPGEEPVHVLEQLNANLPALEWLVVKVPSAEGVLYRTARAMRPIAAGPYEQLYQVDTNPPHHQYFTPRSLAAVLRRSGYVLADLLVDSDVDDVFHRLHGAEWLPGGAALARALRLLEGDSLIAFARPATSIRHGW
ncbi:MAG TPA: class I SAM-dependent methyltransferase [Polyangiaceae bacterium]